MKTTRKFTIAALLSAFIFSGVNGQEEKHKFHIYMDMEKNGETITIDTSFSDRNAMESYMKANGYELPAPPPRPAVPPPPPGLHRMPAPPTPPTPPDAPAPGFPGTKQEIIIDIDNPKISEEQKQQLKEEMKQYRHEMKKAGRDMEQLKKERKDFEKVRIQLNEERKIAPGINRTFDKIEIDQLVNEGNDIIIIRNCEGEKEKNVRFIKINCDSTISETEKILFLKHPVEEKIIVTENDDNTVQDISEPEQNSFKTVAENRTDVNKLNATDFKVFPNPTQGKITVSFKVETAGTIELRLLDAGGKVIVDDKVTTPDGNFSQEYTLEGNARGTYLLQLKQGDKWKHEKIILK
jgi:hypothetical protein